MNENAVKNKPSHDGIKHYLSASVLTTVAGLFTFPILTRLLSKADYGIFSLVQTFQLIYEAVLKGGVQFTIRRYYPLEFLDEEKGDRVRFVSTIMCFPLMLTLLVSFISCVVILLFCYLFSENYYWLLLVILSAQASIVISFFRSYMQAAGLSKFDSIIDVTQKYLYLVLVIPFVAYMFTNYLGVYWAIFISYSIIALFTIWINRDIFKYLSFKVDFSFLKTTLSYSLPFVLVELSVLSISYIDRVVLAVMGVPISEIGTYAIGFGLANVVFLLIWKVLYPTIFPIVNKLYDFQGADMARDYLSKSMSLILLMSISLSVGIFLNYEEFIVLICGEDKIDSGLIFLLATILFLIKIIDTFLFYGFDLLKKTKLIFYSELVVAVVNILLNIIFIYYFGLLGAMLASYMSVFFGIVFKLFLLPDYIRIKFFWNGYVKVIIALCVYIAFHKLIIEPLFVVDLFVLLSSIGSFIIIMLINFNFWVDEIDYVFRFDLNNQGLK